MSQSKIYKPSEINPTNLKFELKQGKTMKTIDIKYLNGQKLVFQLTKKNAPFGISDGIMTDKTKPDQVKDPNAPKKWSVNVQFPKEANPEQTLINDIDNYIINELTKNSQSYFDKKLSKEIVTHSYGKAIKAAKKLDPNGQPYASTLKIKLNLNYKDHTPDFNFFEGNSTKLIETYDKNTKQLLLDDPKFQRFEITPIIQLDCIYIVGNNYYPSWKMKAAKIFFNSFANNMIDASQFHEDEEKTDIEETIEITEQVEEVNNDHDDSEEIPEEVDETVVEEEEESPPTPEPVPVPVKKIVKKK